jgi:hypothetical protein
MESYDYYRALSEIIALFGKENIFVIPYEDLANNRKSFFRRLSVCFDQDLSMLTTECDDRVNIRSRKYDRLPREYVSMGHFLRKLNNLSGYRLEKLLPARKAGITPGFRNDLMARFVEGNRHLDDIFNLNLNRYGYY